MKSSSNTKPNYFYSIISVALVLFLFGFLSLTILYAKKLITHSKENIVVMIELDKEVSKMDKTELINQLTSKNYVKENSVEFISKDDAAEEMKDELGDYNEYGFQNPFHDVITFNTNADYMHSRSLEKIKEELKTNENVYDVYYQAGVVADIEKNLKKASYFVIGLGILFLTVAVTLIHNTIKLALYANRFLIKNMQLVGASWRFISRPYLWKSIKNGFWSALIAILGLLGLLYLTQIDIPELNLRNASNDLLALAGGIFAIGIVITFLSTYYVVNKYLVMRVDDLY